MVSPSLRRGFTKRFTFLVLLLSIKFKLGDFAEADYGEYSIGKLFENFEAIGSYISCHMLEAIYPIFRITASDVKFDLFTQDNPNKPCNLQPNEEALRNCKFDPKAPTRVLIHGWIQQHQQEDKLLYVIKDKLLEKVNHNVVLLNWTYYTEQQAIPTVALPLCTIAAMFVGVRLSSWIHFIQKNTGANPDQFHLMSHSLGTVVASYAGKTTCTIGKITFMDTMGPILRFLPEFMRPSYRDAIYTEGIHTNKANSIFGGDGLPMPYAHIDYYPNGGSRQPKCRNPTLYNEIYNKSGTLEEFYDCDHYAPYVYYVVTFRDNCHFKGLICDSYDDYLSGKCASSNATQCEMFKDAEKHLDVPPHSKCYLKTSKDFPYCLN